MSEYYRELIKSVYPRCQSVTASFTCKSHQLIYINIIMIDEHGNKQVLASKRKFDQHINVWKLAWSGIEQRIFEKLQ